MNTVLSAIGNHGRLTCAWVPTGNPRTPLVCIWKEVSASPAYTTHRPMLDHHVLDLAGAFHAQMRRRSTHVDL
jgi:hypothetical protein